MVYPLDTLQLQNNLLSSLHKKWGGNPRKSKRKSNHDPTGKSNKKRQRKNKENRDTRREEVDIKFEDDHDLDGQPADPVAGEEGHEYKFCIEEVKTQVDEVDDARIWEPAVSVRTRNSSKSSSRIDYSGLDIDLDDDYDDPDFNIELEASPAKTFTEEDFRISNQNLEICKEEEQLFDGFYLNTENDTSNSNSSIENLETRTLSNYETSWENQPCKIFVSLMKMTRSNLKYYNDVEYLVDWEGIDPNANPQLLKNTFLTSILPVLRSYFKGDHSWMSQRRLKLLNYLQASNYLSSQDIDHSHMLKTFPCETSESLIQVLDELLFSNPELQSMSFQEDLSDAITRESEKKHELQTNFSKKIISAFEEALETLTELDVLEQSQGGCDPLELSINQLTQRNSWKNPRQILLKLMKITQSNLKDYEKIAGCLDWTFVEEKSRKRARKTFETSTWPTLKRYFAGDPSSMCKRYLDIVKFVRDIKCESWEELDFHEMLNHFPHETFKSLKAKCKKIFLKDPCHKDLPFSKIVLVLIQRYQNPDSKMLSLNKKFIRKDREVIQAYEEALEDFGNFFNAETESFPDQVASTDSREESGEETEYLEQVSTDKQINEGSPTDLEPLDRDDGGQQAELEPMAEDDHPRTDTEPLPDEGNEPRTDTEPLQDKDKVPLTDIEPLQEEECSLSTHSERLLDECNDQQTDTELLEEEEEDDDPPTHSEPLLDKGNGQQIDTEPLEEEDDDRPTQWEPLLDEGNDQRTDTEPLEEEDGSPATHSEPLLDKGNDQQTDTEPLEEEVDDPPTQWEPLLDEGNDQRTDTEPLQEEDDDPPTQWEPLLDEGNDQRTDTEPLQEEVDNPPTHTESLAGKGNDQRIYTEQDEHPETFEQCICSNLLSRLVKPVNFKSKRFQLFTKVNKWVLTKDFSLPSIQIEFRNLAHSSVKDAIGSLFFRPPSLVDEFELKSKFPQLNLSRKFSKKEDSVILSRFQTLVRGNNLTSQESWRLVKYSAHLVNRISENTNIDDAILPMLAYIGRPLLDCRLLSMIYQRFLSLLHFHSMTGMRLTTLRGSKIINLMSKLESLGGFSKSKDVKRFLKNLEEPISTYELRRLYVQYKKLKRARSDKPTPKSSKVGSLFYILMKIYKTSLKNIQDLKLDWLRIALELGQNKRNLRRRFQGPLSSHLKVYLNDGNYAESERKTIKILRYIKDSKYKDVDDICLKSLLKKFPGENLKSLKKIKRMLCREKASEGLNFDQHIDAIIRRRKSVILKHSKVDENEFIDVIDSYELALSMFDKL